jgi:hypothetical protein
MPNNPLKIAILAKTIAINSPALGQAPHLVANFIPALLALTSPIGCYPLKTTLVPKSAS